MPTKDSPNQITSMVASAVMFEIISLISINIKKQALIMDTLTLWILAIIGFGLFVYFVPYRNIKIIQNKLDKIIELIDKK